MIHKQEISREMTAGCEDKLITCGGGHMVLPCMLHLSPIFLLSCVLRHLLIFAVPLTLNMPESAPESPSSPKPRYSKHIIVGTPGREARKLTGMLTEW